MNHENRIGRLTRTQDIAARIGMLLLLSGAYVAHEATSPRPVIAQTGDWCGDVDGQWQCVGGGEASRARRENAREPYIHQGPEVTQPERQDLQGVLNQVKQDSKPTWVYETPKVIWESTKAAAGWVWEKGVDAVSSDTQTVMCNGVQTTLLPGESVTINENGSCILAGNQH